MKTFLKGRIALFILGIFSVVQAKAQISAEGEIPPIPASIGALGDSITAGALAKYRRQDGNKPWVQLDLMLHIFELGLTRKVGAMEFRELSWSTGTDNGKNVISHARRIAALRQAYSMSEKLKIYNAAVSGDEVNDVLVEQLPRMMDWSRQNLNGREAPEYVTVLIGANDVCAKDTTEMTPVNDYYNRLYESIDTLMERSPDTKVLVLSLPNIERLRAVAKDAIVFGIKGLGGVTCEKLWGMLKLCPTLTTISDPTERLKVAERVNEFNGVMKSIVATEAKKHGDRIRYSEKVFETDFNKNDLSLDCFHPNPGGQNMLSKGTWAQSWWGSMWFEGYDQRLSKNKKLKPIQ